MLIIRDIADKLLFLQDAVLAWKTNHNSIDDVNDLLHKSLSEILTELKIEESGLKNAFIIRLIIL